MENKKSTKGRKPTGDVVLQHVKEDEFNEAVNIARDAIATKQDQDHEELFELGTLLGQMQSFEFILTVGNFATVQVFEKVKKSKAWEKLKNPNSHGENYFTSLNEFCEVKLGKSYKRLQTLSLSIRTLGEEAYEQSEILGLRQVDHNAIRALPTPDQELIKKALAEGTSKEEVQDLLQELAAKNAADQQVLQANVEEAKQEKSAMQALLDAKNKQLDRASAKQKMLENLPADEALNEMRTELTGFMNQSQAHIEGTFRWAIKTILEYEQEHGLESAAGSKDFCAGAVAQIQRTLILVRDEFGLADTVGDGDPEWKKWAKEQGHYNEDGSIKDGVIGK